MTLRFVRPASLMVGLLLFGCALPLSREETPGPLPAGFDPTEPTIHPPPLEAPLLQVPIAPELWQSGGRLVVSRLHASRPVQESVTDVAVGSRIVEVPGGEGEVLAVSVLDRAGELSETALVPTGVSAWPARAEAPRTLRVPQEYATIQAAVDAARAGDTVRVRSGTYFETVRLKSGIRLLGSGAAWTLLDGGGAPVKLVDFSGATDVVVEGFTFQNVGEGGTCARNDVLECAGVYYPAGIFADGHAFQGEDATSALILHNIFRGNATGVLLYFQARAVVRNNLFVGNTHGFVANHLQDVGLLANNTFWGNTRLAIANSAAALDILNNVVVGSDVGVFYEYIQTGRVRCNLFFQNGATSADRHLQPPRFELGQEGNLGLDPRFVSPQGLDFHPEEDSPLRGAGCFEGQELDQEWMRADIGAYGGPLGNWQ